MIFYTLRISVILLQLLFANIWSHFILLLSLGVDICLGQISNQMPRNYYLQTNLSKVHCSSDWRCSLVTYLFQSPQRANCLLFNKSVNALSVLQLILGDFLTCLSSLVALARRDWNRNLYKLSRQYVWTTVVVYKYGNESKNILPNMMKDLTKYLLPTWPYMIISLLPLSNYHHLITLLYLFIAEIWWEK